MRFWISTTFQLRFRLCDVVKCHSYRKSAIFRDAIVSTKRKIENWDRNSFPPAALKSTKKSRGNYRWCGRQWHWQVPKRDMNANQYHHLSQKFSFISIFYSRKTVMRVFWKTFKILMFFFFNALILRSEKYIQKA